MNLFGDPGNRCVHVSTVHPRHDTRILYRECMSLAQAGLDVTLMVADGNGQECVNGVEIVDIGARSKSRILRLLLTDTKMLWRLLKIKAAVFHFHDPELIIAATVLRWRGNKVIFDVHENITKQIRHKQYIPGIFRRLLSAGAHVINSLIKSCSGIVLAETSYAPIYADARGVQVTVLNLPNIDQFDEFVQLDRSTNGNEIIYVGGISASRGMKILAQALEILDQKGIAFVMHLFGRVTSPLEWPDFKHGQVKLHGFKPANEAYAWSRKCKVGVSILQPIPNYFESYSTKVFEYMSVGLPFVTSDFPIYSTLTEQTKAGICVNPTDPVAVAAALESIFNDPERSLKFGQNGVAATRETWNWNTQAETLLTLYRQLGIIGNLEPPEPGL